MMGPFALLMGIVWSVVFLCRLMDRSQRVVFWSTYRQIYLFLHPWRKSMPQSLAEARKQGKSA